MRDCAIGGVSWHHLLCRRLRLVDIREHIRILNLQTSGLVHHKNFAGTTRALLWSNE